MLPANGQTRVSEETLRAIVDRHGLRASSDPVDPWVGSASCVYRLGEDFVLKVPRDNPSAIASMRIEAIAAEAARAAGVRTPRLVAFDDARDLLPVPYLVFERILGQPVGQLGELRAAGNRVWHEVGVDLARLHTGVQTGPALGSLPSHGSAPDNDPRPWVEEVRFAGGLRPDQARWLADLLEQLAPVALDSPSPCVCHGDVNAGNVMVGPGPHPGYLALLDWGGAGWADPALDFSGIALRAIPSVLAGYREVAPVRDDATAEARILWFYLRLALFGLRRPELPESDVRRRSARLLRDTSTYLAWSRLDPGVP